MSVTMNHLDQDEFKGGDFELISSQQDKPLKKLGFNSSTPLSVKDKLQVKKTQTNFVLILINARFWITTHGFICVTLQITLLGKRITRQTESERRWRGRVFRTHRYPQGIKTSTNLAHVQNYWMIPQHPGHPWLAGQAPRSPQKLQLCERGGQNIEGPKETAAWLEVVVPDAERQGVQEVDAVVDRPTLYGKLLHTLFLELTPCRVRSCVKWIVLSQM